MKTTVDAAALKQHIHWALRAVPPSRPSLPVLSNIKIETRGQRIVELSTTCLDMAYRGRLTGSNTADGGITVPTKKLGELIATMEMGELTLAADLKTQTLSLWGGSSHINLKGIGVEEFPKIPNKLDDAVEVSLSAGLFKRVVQQTVYAAATDANQPMFVNGYLQLADATLTLACTDGFRLAQAKSQLDKSVSNAVNYLLPAKALALMADLVKDEEQTVKLTLGRELMFFTVGNQQVISRIGEGKFPPYQKLIPTNFTHRLVVNANELAKATKRAALFCPNTDAVLFAPGDDAQLIIQSLNDGVGSTANAIDVLDMQGEGTHTRFKSQDIYITQALATMTTPTVALELQSTSKDRIALRPIGDERIEVIHIIMPANPLKKEVKQESLRPAKQTARQAKPEEKQLEIALS